MAGPEASGSTPSSSSSSSSSPTLRQIFTRYGKVALVLHYTISALTTAGLYFAIKNGLDPTAKLKQLGLLPDDQQPPPTDAAEPEDPAAGGNGQGSQEQGAGTAWSVGPSLAAAYLCNKALMPVRTPLTITLTPMVSRWVQKLSKAAR